MSKDLKRWFIESFIHTRSGRTFALRNNGLEDGPRLQSRVIDRNAAYHFSFMESDEGYIIVPVTDQARWAAGRIYTNAAGHNCFVSWHAAIDMKTLEDQISILREKIEIGIQS